MKILSVRLKSIEESLLSVRDTVWSLVSSIACISLLTLALRFFIKSHDVQVPGRNDEARIAIVALSSSKLASVEQSEGSRPVNRLKVALGVCVTSTRRLCGKGVFFKRPRIQGNLRHISDSARWTTRRRESERVAPVRSKRWGKFRRRGSRKSLNLDCTSEMTLLPRKTSFRRKGISSASSRKKREGKKTENNERNEESRERETEDRWEEKSVCVRARARTVEGGGVT